MANHTTRAQRINARRDKIWEAATERTAYKGYIVQRSITGLAFYITKDGHNIATGNSEADARQMIDQLADDHFPISLNC